jgi:hypothetical protein
MMNVEQGMSNDEGIVRTYTSAFEIPCSIFIIPFSVGSPTSKNRAAHADQRAAFGYGNVVVAAHAH